MKYTLFFLLLHTPLLVLAETPQAVTIDRQGSLNDQADKVPFSCQDLIEDNHRLQLNNEYLKKELTTSMAFIEKMKLQMEQLITLQTQLYQKLEQQTLSDSSHLSALPPSPYE